MSLKSAEFAALDPFFEVVQRGLSGFVDGEHYFDTIVKNAIFEFRYDIAGWPKRVESRDALMALYRAYGDSIVLHGGDGLVKAIKVGQLGNVSLHSRNVGAECPHGLVEFPLAAARDEDIGTLLDEPFRGREPNPVCPAGDDGGLTFELFGHCLSLSFPSENTPAPMRHARSLLSASTAWPRWYDKWFVRLNRTAKRFLEASFAKSSSDTAACRWTQSFHDIFSNPFHSSALTAFHASRTCSCEGMSARDLSGFEMKATSNSG
jgi:hypothetical protein